MTYLQTCFDVTLFLFIFTLSLSDVSATSETIYSDEVEKDNVDDSLSYTSLSQCQTKALKEMCLAKRSGNELVCVQSGVECVRNIDCCTRKRLHCYAGKCVKNVCKGKCGPQTLCTVSIENKAVCSCKPGYTGNPKDRRNGCKRVPDCVEHKDCSSGQLCYAGKCVKNVCTGSCGANTQCTVSIDNKAVCTCKLGNAGNPADKRKSCAPIPDCVEHKDCSSGQLCYAGKCVKNVCTGSCGANTQCTVSIDNKAVCSCKLGYFGNPADKSKGCSPTPNCVEHKDCSSGLLCYAGKCVKNVCTDSCGANTQCTVSINNKAVCTCKSGYAGNPADRSKGCEPNPIKHKKTFYWGPTNLSWNEAKKYCERKGHKLARILNKEENNQVLEILKDIFHPSHIHGVWLGGYIPHKGEPSYWVNPHAVFDYSYFHPGEPNNKGGAEHCLEFWYANKVWKWSDGKCVLEKPVICEKNNN